MGTGEALYVEMSSLFLSSLVNICGVKQIKAQVRVCVPGRSPVSAALRSLGVLSRSAQVRVAMLPAVSRLRVADHSSVPFSAGVQ